MELSRQLHRPGWYRRGLGVNGHRGEASSTRSVELNTVH